MIAREVRNDRERSHRVLRTAILRAGKLWNEPWLTCARGRRLWRDYWPVSVQNGWVIRSHEDALPLALLAMICLSLIALWLLGGKKRCPDVENRHCGPDGKILSDLPAYSGAGDRRVRFATVFEFRSRHGYGTGLRSNTVHLTPERRCSGLKGRRFSGLKGRRCSGLKGRRCSGLKGRRFSGLKGRRFSGLKGRLYYSPGHRPGLAAPPAIEPCKGDLNNPI